MSAIFHQHRMQRDLPEGAQDHGETRSPGVLAQRISLQEDRKRCTLPDETQRVKPFPEHLRDRSGGLQVLRLRPSPPWTQL